MNRFYYLDSYNGEPEHDIRVDFDNQESAVTTAVFDELRFAFFWKARHFETCIYQDDYIMIEQPEIRNSTAEFLIFQIEGKEEGVHIVYRYESIWCTQKVITQLIDVGAPAISKHPKVENMYSNNFLRELRTSEHALT